MFIVALVGQLVLFMAGADRLANRVLACLILDKPSAFLLNRKRVLRVLTLRDNSIFIGDWELLLSSIINFLSTCLSLFSLFNKAFATSVVELLLIW